MKGTYTVKDDGLIVARANNILTTAAKDAILRYLAGERGSWAGAIAIGASDRSPELSDRRLGFEFGRGDVNIRAPDFDESAVLVKATIPKSVAGEVYELGMFSSFTETKREVDQALISNFNPEGIDSSAVELVESRVGGSSTRIHVESGGTDVIFDNIGIDISGIGKKDRFILAIDSLGIDSIEFRIINSPGNYLYYSFSPGAGYDTYEWSIDDFIVVGNGTIENEFYAIEVVATPSALEGELILDGFRLDDTEVFEDQELVSRAIVSQPFRKTRSRELEIEYSISFNL